jgi:lysozyme
MFPNRAFDILAIDVARIWGKMVSDLPWVTGLADVYAGVLKNMSFNMGAHGVELFHHMLADIQTGNYLKAAADMQASTWYTQVGQRAERLVQQMKTGVWQ